MVYDIINQGYLYSPPPVNLKRPVCKFMCLYVVHVCVIFVKVYVFVYACMYVLICVSEYVMYVCLCVCPVCGC